MANNEDYLDSLLMAAQSQGGPDSAIEMIRKVENGEKSAEQVIADNTDNNDLFKAADDTAASLLAELNSINEEYKAEEPVASDDSPVVPFESASVQESENTASAVTETETVDEVIPATETVDEVIPVTETVDEVITAAESAVEVIPTAENAGEAIIEAEIPADIDALLSSDFAGEIELPLEDIQNLSGDGEKSIDDLLEERKLSESDIAVTEEPADAGNNDTSSQTDDYDEAIKMMNMGLFNEKSQDDKSDAMISLEELALEMDDVAAMEAELGIHDKNDISSSLSSDAYALAGDAEALNEISGLLDAIDSNEVKNSDDFDVLSLVNEALSKQEAEDEAVSLNEKNKKDKKEKPKKEKKKRGKKAKQDGEAAETAENADVDTLVEKKKGFFGRMIDFLTAEEDDPENMIQATDEAGKSSDGFEDVKGENKEILDEIDKEEDEKGKKKKKKKDKKGKKGDKPASGEDGEESEDGGEKKDKKAKKPKKEKKPLELDVDTGKPLSKRNVRLVAILAASLLVAIILFCTIVPKMIVNSQARKAFYKGDYETTYNTFFGEEKLSESDRIMFSKSEIILKITHKYDAYKAYNNLNMPMEALDQLLQAVKNYELWLYAAESVGAKQEFGLAYAKILAALLGDYDLSEEAAREINALPTDEEYSLKVYSVVNHTEYIDPEMPLPAPFAPPTEEDTNNTPQYSDMLEEEGN